MDALEYQIVDLSDSSSELHLFNVQVDNNNDVITCYVEVPSGLNSEDTITIMVGDQEQTTNIPTTISDNGTVRDAMSNAGFPAYIIIPLAGAFGGVIVILVIIIVTIIVCRRHRKQGVQPEAPGVIIDSTQSENVYQMNDIGADNEPEPYVISQISGNAAGTTATMGSEHLYARVNRESSQNQDLSSYDQLNRSHVSGIASPPSQEQRTGVSNDRPYSHLN